MKNLFGVAAALAVLGVAGVAHAAVGVHGALAVAGPPVPEPGTLGIIGLGSLLLLRRKRR
ncbi:MAG: PEP-CTERM sorting domain-containing protein [Phycisphaerae bacterium]